MKDPVSVDGWVPVDSGGDIRIRARLEERDGRMVVTGLFMSGGHITATQIQNLQLARIEAAATVAMPQGGEVRTRAADDREEGIRDAVARMVIERSTGQIPDDYFQLVAGCYLAAAVETSNPVALLARESRIPHETLRRWVKEARKRGYLPKGLEGRAG